MQKYVRIGIALLAAALTIVRLPAQSAAPAAIYSPYIFAWIGDGPRQSSDFLAVIDADPKSSSYGRVVATLPVNARATMPVMSQSWVEALRPARPCGHAART